MGSAVPGHEPGHGLCLPCTPQAGRGAKKNLTSRCRCDGLTAFLGLKHSRNIQSQSHDGREGFTQGKEQRQSENLGEERSRLCSCLKRCDCSLSCT